MFSPVARRLLPSAVFDQIRARILRGEMAPGAPLPAERSLAELLGVNRNAVREGLKRLQQAGLVAIQHGGVTRVLDFKRTAGLEVLATMVVSPEGMVDTRIVRSILELRTELAPIVGRLAARRATKAHLDALRTILAAIRGANDDSAVLVRLALDLWATVVAATDNLALELAFNSLAVSYGSVLDHIRHVMSDEVRAVGDYEALVEAIAAKQPDKAAVHAQRIVRRGETSIGKLTKAVDVLQRSPAGKRNTRP
jgi:fatty acid metabolism transcriptional regulator FadR